MARKDLRTPDNIQKIIEMKKTHTLQEIADMFNCSATLIRNICLENNTLTLAPNSLIPGKEINNYLILRREFNLPWSSHENGYWVKCLKCGAEVLKRKSEIDKHCHDCNNERGGRGHCKIPPVGTKFGYLTTTGNYINHKTNSNHYHMYFEVQCECGSKPFFVQKDRLFGRKNHSRTISCGCASRSAGEIKIAQLLDDCNIPYEEQYNIMDLSKWMRFDFAIYSKNNDNTILGLIEYDGEQHFRPVERFGGEEKFLIQKERDKRKDQYCKENNIFLLRIPYTDFDKLDKEYLFSRFPKLKNDLV